MNALELTVDVAAIAGAVMVAVGTWVQWRTVADDFRKTEDAEVYRTVEGLRNAVPAWRWVQRRGQRRLVKVLLRESAVERDAYLRASRVVDAWSFLCVGSSLVAVSVACSAAL